MLIPIAGEEAIMISYIENSRLFRNGCAGVKERTTVEQQTADGGSINQTATATSGGISHHNESA